jgi:hypothetical protein
MKDAKDEQRSRQLQEDPGTLKQLWTLEGMQEWITARVDPTRVYTHSNRRPELKPLSIREGKRSPKKWVV